jgi:hypothetical protein
MIRYPKTYYEAGWYYAVIYQPNGHTYYSGAFKCRSTARRYSIRETKRHQFAEQNHMIYNTKGRW